MRTTSLTIKALVIAVIPLLACSTYYTLEKLENAGPAIYLATSLALPVMLLGFIGTARGIASGNMAPLHRWLFGLALALPATLQAFIWL